MSLLEIDNLSLEIGGSAILRGVSLSLAPGKTLAIVGESGSGKSMTALAVMGLLPRTAHAAGTIRLDGTDVLSASETEMCRLRGAVAGMVFQEPMTALNPLKTIGEQVAEGIRLHRHANRRAAEDAAAAMLDRVGLPPARFPLSRYPHELSGGQRQRVVIAIACACNPKLLIADEPTTALDVVIQAQILDLLRDLVAERRMGLLLISHDLGVVADMADRIAVMREGAILETGSAVTVLAQQSHPYTRQLAEASVHVPIRCKVELGSPPSALPGISPTRGEINQSPTSKLPISPPVGEMSGRTEGGASHLQPITATFNAGKSALLQVTDVTRTYHGRRASLFGPRETVKAVDGVSFSIPPGRSVALVGRSGCGKSTLARLVLALDRPDSGSIRLDGRSLESAGETELREARRDMQVVFQDPYGSFDPRQRVATLVCEPLHLSTSPISRTERRDCAAEALREVGLGPDALDRYPHEFSGGQRQRLAIARALITRPKLIVADEPVSALDVSVRARILDLFAELNDRLGLAYLFITHDLHVARAVTDEVLVMDAGRIVERGATGAVLDDPQSEAARALVAAAPDLRRAIARRAAPDPAVSAS